MIKTIKKGFRAFFDFEQKEELVAINVAKKVSLLTAGRLFYGIGDWIIAAGLGSFSFWMQAHHFSNKKVLLSTMIYDLIASAAFFYISDVTNCDFTFGQSLRRLADTFAKNGFWGKLFSGAILFGVSIKAIVWEGPEVICFLFQKELKTKSNIWLALFILSAIQGVFGTWLYTTGYELWKKFGSQFSSHYILLGAATFAIFVVISMVIGKIIKFIFVTIRVLGKEE